MGHAILGRALGRRRWAAYSVPAGVGIPEAQPWSRRVRGMVRGSNVDACTL